MAFIPDSTRSPIFDVVMLHYREHSDLIVQLLMGLGSQMVVDRNGEVRGTCPLHHGQAPANFVVWYDREIPIWKCYSQSCGHGPLYTLVRKKLGLNSDVEAVVYMGQMAGLRVDGAAVVVPREVIDEAEIRAFNRRLGLQAADKYEDFPEFMVSQSMAGGTVYHESNPKPSKRYPREVLAKFEVGFVKGGTWVRHDPVRNCPSGWFEDRVSVPIRLPDGRLIGFSGRRLDDVNFQKYKVLPGTKKGHTLYGLHFPETAREIRRTGKINIVEGFPDVWRYHQHSCYNVCSFMGTDPSDIQMAILGGLPLEEINFDFDGDLAGQTAVEKYAPHMAKLARLSNTVSQAGMDPGDFWDLQAFNVHRESCKPLFLLGVHS